MDKPKRAADTPFGVEVEAGKAYFWCACGLSATQPFCDGSHKDTGFSPAIDGMRELTVTGFFGKEPIAVPITLDLSAGTVVHIGIFDTVDPLVLEVVVYDVQ